jgi:hypothetical protein
MCGQYKKLQENRPAKVNQTDLLNRIMEEIREMRGEGGTKEIDFICIIPKADYYVSNDLSDLEEHHFFNKFYSWLEDDNLVEQSNYTPEINSVAGFCSQAGVAFSGATTSRRDNPLAFQKEVARKISDQAKNALHDVHLALGNENVSEGAKMTIQDYVDYGLIDTIEQNFRETFFLPISAQGKGKPKTEEPGGERDMGHPPSQVLSEYAFIIPIVLAMKDSKK